jgi:hypothetical protein
MLGALRGSDRVDIRELDDVRLFDFEGDASVNKRPKRRSSSAVASALWL